MRISGIFAFKVNLYSYCERYMIAFKDRAYGEMVIHPPPLSFLVAVLLPFSFSRATMKKMAKGVSFAIFWIENIVYIVLFIALEILISPIAFGKIWWKMIDMLKTSAFDGEQDGKRAMCRSCLYLILWFFTGPFIMIWILLLDLINFIVILTHHDGFIRTQEQEKAENKIDDELKIRIYNEIRVITISWFKKIHKYREREIHLSTERH